MVGGELSFVGLGIGDGVAIIGHMKNINNIYMSNQFN